MRGGRRSLGLALAMMLLAKAALHGQTAATPPLQQLDSKYTREFSKAIHQAVWDRVIAGATWHVEHRGVWREGCYGFRAKAPEKESISQDTIFDLASLTKVVATTPSIMLLVEQGRVKLDAPVSTYIPQFAGGVRERITVRHLMVHTSGLKPGLPRNPAWSGYSSGMGWACVAFPTTDPDEKFRYSDINFILLGEIVRRVSGEPLDVFAAKHIFQPLGMKDTGFNPPASWRPRIAPTEKDETEILLRGVVHDPTSRRMGGVAGHAGLFSTVADVSRYARMILNNGELDGVRVLKPETVRLMTTPHTPAGMQDKRALGWDMDTPFSKPRGNFGATSFGHTGFTGTCLWIDPESRSFYVFLSSRLHEQAKGADVRKLYLKLGDRASKALLSIPATPQAAKSS
ncbi:CubicO group peptidase (beta-lactamase class C family) [Roseimicrobium gellanilyticum]|uniref:CubicO group peptidase (Beta-lactamase class C family) n=1 Tax=Roseimicrobium gellanilyticum TaxID=748857 RepID=A0A366H9K8_9BACT|nr:serine hydrolase domain-containing protein [Roseimicrobium gellanilyticum]RBP38507.1 CubicO group peptidase (beta-lactamase class C family) [Roseimicrobium gellanilyticum]